MSRDILFTTAIDEKGDIVPIDQAQKGRSYYCPGCEKKYVLRKSGRVGKGSRRPHFAHKEPNPNCTPESVLHSQFRKSLIQTLTEYQSKAKPFIINWGCTICNNRFSGNLLEKVTSIKEEYNLEECRPDIALLDEKESVVAVIEVVVTHEPEERVLEFYKKEDIILVQIKLTSDEDLIKIEEKAASPSIVELCLKSKCSGYRNNNLKRELVFETRMCGHCFRPVKACKIRTSHVFGIQHSTDFNDKELEDAKSNGVRLEMRINQSTGEEYPAVTCLNCKIIRSRYNRGRIF